MSETSFQNIIHFGVDKTEKTRYLSRIFLHREEKNEKVLAHESQKLLGKIRETSTGAIE